SEITGLQGPYTFECLQQQIMDSYMYKQIATTIPAHPVLQSRNVGIEEFFVPLQLIKNIPGKTESKRLVTLPEGKIFLDEMQFIALDSLDDLFNPEIVKEIKILLFGGAGTGKSTLLVKIANSCITLSSKPLLGRFDLVLWIKLRQMQQSSCVLDAIFDQLLAQSTKLTKHIVKEFIDDHESRIALLLDGLDEIPSHVLQSKEGVYRVQDILCNRVLTKSFVLITTRPHMVEYVLRGHPKYAQVYTCGFTSQDRDQYIRLNLPDDADMGEALISYLKTNENLGEMSKVPIISQMMCLVWKNQKSLPERITELFGKFAEVLFIRRSEDVSDQQQMSIMMSIINGLGHVALQGLLDSRGERLVFDKTEFQDCQSCLDEGCRVGFVQQETFTSGVDVKVLVTFHHKSIQEHFAACHLAKLLEDDENNFCHQLKQIGPGKVYEMEYLLRFCCGRSRQAAGLILDHIQEMQPDERKLQRLARLFLLESGSEELATKLVRPTSVKCTSNEDMKSLCFYLQHVTPPLEGTTFRMHVRKHELALLSEILASDSMESAKVKVVKYRLSERETEELSGLEQTLGVVDEHHRARLYILVWIAAKSWFDVGRVSHSLFRMQEQIDRLGLVMNQRSPHEVVDLWKALKGCRLDLLGLTGTDLHAQVRDVSHISSSLRVLQLSACRLVDDDVKDLISILPAGHGLKWLNLVNNAFSLDAMRALTHQLQGLPRLRLLSLSEIGLDPELIRQVVSQDLPRLKEIEEGEFQA
ncbi:nucleotide-binding oligomerization domain-containing protein 2-like, partial [Patiria miniata]|uniref:NACHT domain-containing protein n=1 Tax=Patiria miniata TaxID=46514 RepID=A0A914AF79_PATMI